MHGQDIPAVPAFVRHVVHQLPDQHDPEATTLPVVARRCDVGILRLEGIMRRAAVADGRNDAAVGQSRGLCHHVHSWSSGANSRRKRMAWLAVGIIIVLGPTPDWKPGPTFFSREP